METVILLEIADLWAKWQGEEITGREQREVFIKLSEEINGTLCTFCRYSHYVSDGCCEGYAECEHPVESLSKTAEKTPHFNAGDESGS